MGYWKIGADELANGRFMVSALCETVGALDLLTTARLHPATRDWYHQHIGAYRSRLAGDAVTAALAAAIFSPGWTADYIAKPPHRSDRSFGDELRRVREVPARRVRADLRVATGQKLSPLLNVADLASRSADLLEWVWTHTVRPDWPRRRQILEADIVTRTRKLSTGGWSEALAELNPGMRWLGGGRLQINVRDYPPRDLTGAQLIFIPTTARHGWVTSDEPHRHGIVYSCAGLLADVDDVAPPGALSRLLGPARAVVLSQLASPRSTSQLVAITGYGLGSVGGHLAVLRDAGLVHRRRAGRSVLYFRTPDGDRLVRACA